MANRRMFSKDIVTTDKFVEMPTTAKLLYFDLGIRADDDGFVGSPRQVMNISRASEDDIKVLISKGFVIPFESGVIVITHWNISNQMRKDRRKETIYIEEKNTLFLDESGCYTQNPEEAVSLPFNDSEMESESERKLMTEDNIEAEVEKPLPQENIGKVGTDREEHKPHAQDDGLYGKFKNIKLSDEQYEDLINTYTESELLIDKVSCIFANKERIPKNAFAYIHKIAIEDGFERKQSIEDEKKKQRQMQRQQEEQLQRQQANEEWYQEMMKEYGVNTKEEVEAIARQKLKEFRRGFGNK